MSGTQPAVPPDSILVQTFEGLRNTVAAERLAQGELAVARNIDIDDAKQVRRRRGYTRVATGDFHSMFQGATETYAVKDGVLGVVNPNYTFTAVQTGIGTTQLAYVQVNDKVYYASATHSGVISADRTVAAWGAVAADNTWLSPVVNPTSTLHPVGGRLLGKPPMATSLAAFNGRIYLAEEKTLWATELFLYNYVDKTRTFIQFEHPITMLGTVSDGLYVGTTENVMFLSGAFREMAMIEVQSVGAIPQSLVYVPDELIVNPEPPQRPSAESKNAVLFLTKSGLCVGLDRGICYNLTQTKVIFPDAASAAALFRRQDGVNQYISVVDSGGTPSSAARMGDYVEAEIRRFSGA